MMIEALTTNMKQTLATPMITMSNSTELFANAGHLQLFMLTANIFGKFAQYVSKHNATQQIDQLCDGWSSLMDNNVDYKYDLSAAIIGTVTITMFRLLLNKILCKILLNYRLVHPKAINRVTESAYSCLFYSISFTLAVKLELRHRYLTHPDRLWSEFSLTTPVPSFIYALYLLEVSHYFHSLYAVFFINSWNKDSLVMFFHHIVALILLTISYLARCHRIGILVLYTHDICDVLMESSKCIIKLQLRNPVLVKLQDIARVLGFVAFFCFWFLFRLHYYPLRVIYPSLVYLHVNPVEVWFPNSFLLYCLLWSIYSMNIYWATLILKVLFSFIVGGHQNIDDIRELEEEEEDLLKKKEETSTINGNSTKNKKTN